jgi:DNA mismatch endonuclease (patch repair protein)
MQVTPRKDTSCEMRLRKVLFARGIRYRIHRRPLPALRRDADIVIASLRVAVFVDGCFWHGCPAHPVRFRANRAWWEAKIARTAQRDRQTDRQLRAAGWTVVRVWEHADPEDAAAKVCAAVERARPREGLSPARLVARRAQRRRRLAVLRPG